MCMAQTKTSWYRKKTQKNIHTNIWEKKAT